MMLISLPPPTKRMKASQREKMYTFLKLAGDPISSHKSERLSVYAQHYPYRWSAAENEALQLVTIIPARSCPLQCKRSDYSKDAKKDTVIDK